MYYSFPMRKIALRSDNAKFVNANRTKHQCQDYIYMIVTCGKLASIYSLQNRVF